jgi:ABC-type phosphate transport system substrate-binding protein
MKQASVFFILVSIFLTSCTPTALKPKPEQFTVQYTAVTVPWLASLYSCANNTVVIAEQREADFLDLSSASMVIRLGRPDHLTGYAFQIATDNLLVIVNPKNPTSNLSTDQVYGLFTGKIQNWKSINGVDMQVQAWVYPAGEDIQEFFMQTVLHGSPITSAAHLANNPNEMLGSVQKDENAIGIIIQRWKTGNVTSVYTAASNLPVLANTLSKPQGTLSEILGCMQK